MKTVALRFAENFAPECGTIAAHQQLVDAKGYVWYGKLGNPISQKVAKTILDEDDSRILLIHSGSTGRYWAHVSDISRNTPPRDEIPGYYRDMADEFGCWFRVTRFEKADKNVMSKCVVASSGKLLTTASQHSMSPYFIIEYSE